MNNENRPETSGWYAPLARETERNTTEKTPVPEKKKSAARWRIVLGAVLVLGLIIGSSLAFADRSGRAASSDTRRGAESGAPERDDGFGFYLPGNLPDDDEEEDGLPEDWRDFFSAYYETPSGGKSESRLEREKAGGDWKLALRPADRAEKTLQEIYRDCVDTIVSIRSYQDGKMGYFWGSGIVMSEDGLILTNAHLIEDCDTATVVLQNDEEYEARLIGMDGTSDLAVLKIDAHGLKSAVFGDSELLTVGDRVCAVGNPLSEEFRATLTDGIVSAIDRGINYDGHSMSLIQTNTALNEGNSGGALLNMYGQVVGVTNMKMMSSYSSIEGIGFAIPSTTVRSIVNAILKDGEVRGRPALGITVGAISDMAAEYYGLPGGMYISAVSETADAFRKGVREGDILIAVNGEEVNTTEDVLRIRDTLSIGDTMTLTIWRDGENLDIEIVLGEFNDIY